jgi:ABC-2 type transport system ATP-binding protein
VSLAVPAGQVTVVVGGDGAGKSTLLRCLAGALAPDSGKVRIPDPMRLGYLPASSGVYPDLTVGENLAFRAAAYGVAVAVARERLADLLDRTGLAAAQDRLAGHLSGGMRQKLGVIAALVHRPDLLVLDEPTTGVDPVSRSGLWWLVARAAEAGAAVVLATSYLDDAQRCASVLVLDDGRDLAAGTPDQIVSQMPGSVRATERCPSGAEAQRAWRRGGRWRVWDPPGAAPLLGDSRSVGEAITPDLQDAVTVAALARELGRNGGGRRSAAGAQPQVGRAPTRPEKDRPSLSPEADRALADPDAGLVLAGQEADLSYVGLGADLSSAGLAADRVLAGQEAGRVRAGQEKDRGTPADVAGGPVGRGRPAGQLAQCVGVRRQFGRLTAVRDVDLQVEAGEIVGLLGANGAGKTTLIKMMLGLLGTTAGQVRLFGQPPSRETRRRIGYVPQGLGLYEDLTARENLGFSAAVFGGRRHRLAGKRQPVAAEGGAFSDEIGSLVTVPVGSLPLGVQRRLAFAQALAHRPELLFLDEPTSGVDPLGRARLWETIRAAADRGVGVLVTTHYMEEAGECDRLVIMADGAVVAEGTSAEIIGTAQVTVVAAPSWAAAFNKLEGAGLPVALAGRGVRVPGVGPDAVRRTLDDQHARVFTAPATLEERFFELTSQRGPGAAGPA